MVSQMEVRERIENCAGWFWCFEDDLPSGVTKEEFQEVMKEFDDIADKLVDILCK